MPAEADATFDPVPAIEALARAGVDFVVIGGVAGGVHGSAFGTFDLDVAYSRERSNLQLLAGVLRELDATLRGAPPDRPFQLDADALEEGGNTRPVRPRTSGCEPRRESSTFAGFRYESLRWTT